MSGIRRAFVFLLAMLALACGGDPPAPSVALAIDRTPAERPAETLVELSLDGGDAALAGLIAQLPPVPMRAAMPNRVSTLLDGLIVTPTEIRAHVATASPLRLLMARIDGEVRSAVVVQLDAPLAASDRHGGGPRGTDRVGESSAVDDRLAVVSDDAAMLELSFAYLAYTALPRTSPDGALVLTVPATTLATTVRSALEHALTERRASLLASIAAARAAHDRPPDLGDPEVMVTLLGDALIERLGYLPDLGEATVTLARAPSGLAIMLEANVTSPSPLSSALAEHVPVSSALVAAMPSSSALVLATGTTTATRTEQSGALAEALAAIGGARVGAAERLALDQIASSIAALRGDQGALAIGASDTGPFVIGLTRTERTAAAPTPWGRAFPWTSQLLGALAGCTPTAPRATPTGTTICGDVTLATAASEGVRADALGRDPVVAEVTRAALARDRAAPSPDLARDLAALPASSFAILLARPLRALPLVATISGSPLTGLPRGDGAAVLAFAHAAGRLQIVLRASTAAMADLDVVVHLFADESDSE